MSTVDDFAIQRIRRLSYAMQKTNRLLTRVRRKAVRIARGATDRVTAAVAPDRVVSLYLDRPLTICLPFRTEQQQRSQSEAQLALRSLEADFGPATFIFVTDLPQPEVALMQGNVGKDAVFTPDFRSLVSFLAGAQFHVVLPAEEEAGPTSLREWCEAFHINHSDSADGLVTALRKRGPLELRGPFAATYAVHKSLWLSVMGNQYAFTEPLDWDIVKRLPTKFLEFRDGTAVLAHPVSGLSGPFNRIERQRAIGRLYSEFLQGDDVVDIGCDVRGVEESIGPGTRYHGIDMHGKPDMIMNVDREPLPFPPRSIDTVVCVEALEHLQRIHSVFDDILSISRRHVICSLPVEAAYTGNRLVDSLGGVFSFATPLAPVFDRHQWVGSVSDNLDLIYYRSARKGFRIKRIDLFYMARGARGDRGPSVLANFRAGNVAALNRDVGLLLFVLERDGR